MQGSAEREAAGSLNGAMPSMKAIAAADAAARASPAEIQEFLAAAKVRAVICLRSIEICRHLVGRCWALLNSPLVMLGIRTCF